MFPLCTLNFRLSVAVGELFLSKLGILLSVPVDVVILAKVNLTSLVRVFNGSFRLPPPITWFSCMLLSSLDTEF